MTEIPYDFSTEQPRIPPPCRVLFTAGLWIVPPEERPADWQLREQPQALPAPKPPKQEWATMKRHAPPQVTRAPHKPGAGRPPKAKALKPQPHASAVRRARTRRVTITPQQIADRQVAGETVRQMAKTEKCDPSLLHRILRKAGLLTQTASKCGICGNPTGKAPQAKYCATCEPEAVKARAVRNQKEYLVRLAEHAEKCSADGCETPARIRGMCSLHYQEERRAYWRMRKAIARGTA